MSTEENSAYVPETSLTKIDGVWFPHFTIKTQEELTTIKNYEFGEDDIIVSTYPKSGTGWMLRILSLIRNKADVAKTDVIPLAHATKYVEMEGIPATLSAPEPRVIKSHLIYDHLSRNFREGNSKVIYLARNPKDVIVSFYFHYKMCTFDYQDRSFEEFFERFMKGHVQYGLWDLHVKSFWQHRNDKNVLWINYEDLLEDGHSEIAKIAKFWGKDLSPEQVDTVVRESSFDVMRSKPTASYAKYHAHQLFDETKSEYMRKGKMGDWRNYFTSEMSERIDDLVAKEITPTGMKFRYE